MKNKNQFYIVSIDKEAIPEELILLGDSDILQVNKYIDDSTCFGAYTDGKQAVFIALCEIGRDRIEIKNVAVFPEYQT